MEHGRVLGHQEKTKTKMNSDKITENIFNKIEDKSKIQKKDYMSLDTRGIQNI